MSGVFAFDAAFAIVSPTWDVLSRALEAVALVRDFAELPLRLFPEDLLLLDRDLADPLRELPFDRPLAVERRVFV